MENGKWKFLVSLRRRPLLMAFACLLALSTVWWFSKPSYLELYVPIPSFQSLPPSQPNQPLILDSIRLSGINQIAATVM